MTLPDSRPTVLVTGAARRLGRFIALALAGAGWRVAVHHRSSPLQAQACAQDCSALTPGAFVWAGDLARPETPAQAVAACLAAWGRLDAVVNSASRFEFDSPLDVDAQGLDEHLRANTTAPVLLAQALHRHAQARSAGLVGPAAVVVNLLDQKLWNPNPDFFSYTLSKAALAGAGTLMAQALAPHVRVVGVAPGLTLPSSTMSDAEFAALHRLSPLGRSSTPEDVVSAVRFALDNPSITGTSILVDGGQHLMRFERDFSVMAEQPVDANVKGGGSGPPAGGVAAAIDGPDAMQGFPSPRAALEVPSAAVPAAMADTGLQTPMSGRQVLEITGLRFDANLGILEHELRAPQPIQVDAELHLGQQNLLPQGDNIHHVRDYRKVRQLIIQECTREHTNLLESLIGKLSLRLLGLPGVLGVRLRVAKLAIFDDCEVAIRMEAGRW